MNKVDCAFLSVPSVHVNIFSSQWIFSYSVIDIITFLEDFLFHLDVHYLTKQGNLWRDMHVDDTCKPLV